MSLTFELAEFTVAPEDEAALLEGRREMVTALRRAFPGALGAWLTRQDDGSWLDVVLWRSRPRTPPLESPRFRRREPGFDTSRNPAACGTWTSSTNDSSTSGHER